MWYGLSSNGEPEPNAAAAAVAIPEGATIEDLDDEPWMFSAPLANQIFSIVPGVAGGIAGFILANRLTNARGVSAQEVLLAAGLVASVTFASIFIIRSIEEF